MQKPDPLTIFTHWMQFLEWLLPALEKFPKRVRFSFADRITNLALDVVEDLVDARYTRDKRPILRAVNLKLEKLRMLLRLSHRLHYLPHEGYEYAMRQINETGRMVGGWIKQQEQKDPVETPKT